MDFMGPEALLETPEYGPPLDVFSYGGVTLHVVNQEWPKPLHYVVTDSKTRRITALSEVERRQKHVEKMRGAPADVRILVKECLYDDPSRRPLISDVSERMSRMKEAENVRCPGVSMNPITWQVEQVSEKLGQPATSPTVKVHVQQPVGVPDIFSYPVKVKWKQVAPLPVCRSPCTAVLLHGSVYVGAGQEGKSAYAYQHSYRLDFYNISTNQWNHSPITTAYNSYAMTVLDDKLITVGGSLPKSYEVTNKVLVLDSGQWKEYSEMPTARAVPTAVGHHSMLIVIGGRVKVKGVWTEIPTVELLGTANKCWYTCDSLPIPHFQLKPAIVNNTLYLLGGLSIDRSSAQVFSTSLEAFSSHQIKWQVLTDTPWHFSWPVVVSNKFLLAVGGRHASDPTIQSSEVHVLNPSTGLWELITNIPVPTSGPTVVGVADNKIIILGGSSGSKKRLHSTNVWVGTFE